MSDFDYNNIIGRTIAHVETETIDDHERLTITFKDRTRLVIVAVDFEEYQAWLHVEHLNPLRSDH